MNTIYTAGYVTWTPPLLHAEAKRYRLSSSCVAVVHGNVATVA